MSTFQIVVLGIFSALLVIGVGVFAVLGGVLGGDSIGPVTVWGTVPTETMQTIIHDVGRSDDSFDSVTYVYKNPATYVDELVDAMASGRAPDLFMVTMTDLQTFSDKVIPIPYRAVSQSAFLNSFVDGAQQFLTPYGSLALPFTVDPLVMYWNRDLFAGAGVATPPTYWNDFLALAPKITSLTSGSTVTRATVGLGEWRNVDNAKPILLSLFMQAGENVIVRNTNGALVTIFTRGSGGTNPAAPAESVLRFYTEFANPSKTSYSWNRSLPRSRDMFAAGDLAVYFGFASEAQSLAARNPNLRFGVAPMPQIEGNSTRFTYGNFTGLAIPRSARNPNGAVTIAQKMTGQNFVGRAALALNVPAVRRDVQFDTSANAWAAVAAQAALMARGFLDPDPSATNTIFQSMIESIISGARTPSEAARDGYQELSALLR